ncbi:MAG TPA: substrate-binding domain-containing protein [Xanthobacteraceae bacterium]
MKARLIILLAVLLVPVTARSAEIKLLASAALRGAYLDLLPQFEKTSGHTVNAAWSSSPDIRKRIAGGEAADVVILSSSGAQELIKEQKLAADSRTDFARSGISVAVRSGAPKPDIGSADAVKTAVLAARSIAWSGGASGLYIVRMLEKLGISDQVKTKTAIVKPGEPVGEVVARGEAEIGFHQLSELIPVKGIEIVGPLPPELQHITLFSGGIAAGAKEPEAARALIRFLTAPAAAAGLKQHGLTPG